MNRRASIGVMCAVLVAAVAVHVIFQTFFPEPVVRALVLLAQPAPPPVPMPVLDREAYDKKLRQLAHLDETDVAADAVADPAKPAPPWPAHAVYPQAGALLPFNRIVAYYGNFLSKGMGVLGKYPPDEMVARLTADVKKWEAADPTTPVIAGIDYIAVTAQASPGIDGKYRARMSDKEIQKALAMAKRVNGVVILEVQPGLADLMGEIRLLEPYLSLPDVFLAIDPEFVMAKSRVRPGKAVGTVDAKDVNAAAEFLASLVRDHGLPPKILIVHRYTSAMVTNASKILPLPEVQIVMDMDGWGPQAQKLNTYYSYIASVPVQFTGFKLFTVNDLTRRGSRMLTPAEVLDLMPTPSFIQYQ